MEEQRKGRNRSTVINRTYIDGGTYRRKFDLLTNDRQINRLLYGLAKTMLYHRSGTLYEDMYWINVNRRKVIASETGMMAEEKVIYSDATIREIRKYEGLLIIHTHPYSYPPSIDDFNSNYEHEYGLEIVVCHDGKIFAYRSYQFVSAKRYELEIADYKKMGYTEYEAQVQTLRKLSKEGMIDFKEV